MRKPYLYKLETDFVYAHLSFSNTVFENDWMCLRDGYLRIKKGYAWDGCTPKIDVAGLCTIGTPEGRLHEGKPITYYASLVHDVLCQFRKQLPFTKKESVLVFSDLLRTAGFPLAPIYCFFVDQFGPQDFQGDSLC